MQRASEGHLQASGIQGRVVEGERTPSPAHMAPGSQGQSLSSTDQEAKVRGRAGAGPFHPPADTTPPTPPHEGNLALAALPGQRAGPTRRGLAWQPGGVRATGFNIPPPRLQCWLPHTLA